MALREDGLFGPDDQLVKPGELAIAMGVDPKTVYRWGRENKLPYVRTLGANGGARRYSLKGIERECGPEMALRCLQARTGP